MFSPKGWQVILPHVWWFCFRSNFLLVKPNLWMVDKNPTIISQKLMKFTCSGPYRWYPGDIPTVSPRHSPLNGWISPQLVPKIIQLTLQMLWLSWKAEALWTDNPAYYVWLERKIPRNAIMGLCKTVTLHHPAFRFTCWQFTHPCRSYMIIYWYYNTYIYIYVYITWVCCVNFLRKPFIIFIPWCPVATVRRFKRTCF